MKTQKLPNTMYLYLGEMEKLYVDMTHRTKSIEKFDVFMEKRTSDHYLVLKDKTQDHLPIKYEKYEEQLKKKLEAINKEVSNGEFAYKRRN